MKASSRSSLRLVAWSFFLAACSLCPNRLAAQGIPDTQVDNPVLKTKLNKYEDRIGKLKPELLKIVASSKKNSKSQWHSKCDEALKLLAEFDGVTLDAYNQKWLETEKQTWMDVKSIGGEIADENQFLEFALGDLRKDYLQSKRDADHFFRRAGKSLENYSDEFRKLISKYVNDLENTAKLALGSDFERGEIPTKVDDAIQALAKYRKQYNIFKGQFSGSYKLFKDLRDHLAENKSEQFQACTRRIRKQRRRIESLVRRNMAPRADKFFVDLEEKIELVALNKLDLYQDVLDDWVEVNRPFERDLDEFVAEAIAPGLVAALKSIPKMFLGHSLPSLTYSPDESLDRLLDSFALQMQSTENFLAKEGKENFEFVIAALEQQMREDLDALKIKYASKAARATSDSQEEIDQINREIERLKNVIKGKKFRLNKLDQNHPKFAQLTTEISELEEQVVAEENERKLESIALEKELAQLRERSEAEQEDITSVSQRRIDRAKNEMEKIQ